MVIKTLMEDTSIGELWEKEHGLSLYLETDRHRLLFDTGKSGLFLTNAARMEVDVSKIDTVVISHGHYDHGGGLPAFLEQNKEAVVYLHEEALEPYFVRRGGGGIDYIGIDQTLRENSQIRPINGTVDIDKDFTIFSDVTGQELRSEANDILLERKDGEYQKDRFSHEQNLIVRKKDGARLLISGCAHSGIVNIIERFKELEGAAPDVVIGGFHLMEPGSGRSIPRYQVEAVADRLLCYEGEKNVTSYYTCHCTGTEAFGILKERMGDRISYLSAGSEIYL
ncbi:MBL fold metallo-hydrolase [Lacrimispora sp. NSJ-141]|uniref:MBL fold metallo-hydrolase n=1 Tax=Lientehia hominis TaxID=2897778 RepID=A0AAP2W9Q0_9FIRM|nr:MBL fold metallo-hydrolase [Lientehia hominis]MCD2493556.1 MBL fold metallo-hydrolase [Lientehia hominis]